MADLKGTAVLKTGMKYGKLISDARFQKPPKRKCSFRTVAYAVRIEYFAT